MWIKTCDRRESLMAVLHELSEIGLISIIYNHDQALGNYGSHDKRIKLHNRYKSLR